MSSLLRRRFSTTANPSAILNPSNPSAVLTSKQKSLAALSLLKQLKSSSSSAADLDADRILSICRAAALTPSSPIDRSALSLAVSLLSPSPSSARSLVSSLLVPGHVPYAITLLAHAHLLPEALSLFRSHSPSVSTLNSLLSAALIAKDPPSVARFYQDLPKSYNLSPDLTTYNTLIKSLSESGSTRSAYSVLDEMRARSITPNATTFTNALAGFYKEEKFDDVKKVLRLMKGYGCNPGSLAVYNVRIEGLCKLKRVKEAMDLYREMLRKRMKPNWVTYDRVIVGFCKEGDLEEAKRVYETMKKSKGVEAVSACYFKLVYYLCEGGDFEGAMGVCRDAMEKNWVPCFKTMKKLVSGLAKVGRVEEAKEVAAKMKERFPSQEEMWKEAEESITQ